MGKKNTQRVQESHTIVLILFPDSSSKTSLNFTLKYLFLKATLAKHMED